MKASNVRDRRDIRWFVELGLKAKARERVTNVWLFLVALVTIVVFGISLYHAGARRAGGKLAIGLHQRG
jgi:hypothetical protein